MFGEKIKQTDMNNIKNLITGIKVILWLSLVGFGVTLINTTGLLINSDKMIANVRLKSTKVQSLPQSELVTNAGTLEFKSESILDRVLFKHVYGYHDFLQSLFTFTMCCILLGTIYKLDLSNPFSSSITKRIMSIGLLYIGYGVITILAAVYMSSRIETISHEVTSAYYSFRDDLSNIKIGAFILVLSVIYRVGVKFQEENRLTI
jgi:hypothetical protein